MTRSDMVFGYLMAAEGVAADGWRSPSTFRSPEKASRCRGRAGTRRWLARRAPDGIQSPVEAQFGKQYQAALRDRARARAAKSAAIGDVEVLAGWQYVTEKVRVLGAVALALPTGKYKDDAKPDIGAGNFYTLRPALQLAYLPTPDLAFAAKISSVSIPATGTTNFAAATGWAWKLRPDTRPPIGVVGLHAIRLQQYQDDDNNPFGASRIRSTNAGAFFTTLVPGIDAALTIQYIKTFSSRNIKDATFAQVRLIKVF